MTARIAQPRKDGVCNRDEGFTLVELLVAAGLALVVCGAALGFVWTQVSAARTQPDAADLQQRARAVAGILSASVSAAGAWGDFGGAGPGPACCIPVVVPRRVGTLGADAPTTARPDVLTVHRAAAASIPGRLRDPLPGTLAVQLADGCVDSRPVCGFVEGDHVVVFDPLGRHDFFLLGPPEVDSAPLLLRQAGPAWPHAPGAVVAVVETSTYYFDSASRQLRLYDGHRSDMPIIDDVAAVRFEYWGTPGVPARARVEAGTETCWFDVDGQPRFGRGTSSPGAANVRIALEEFRDGPWCGAGDNRFDADLLRIRLVRAVIRLSAASEAARGVGADYQRPGRALSALRLVPDVEVVIDATPRALGGDY